jgi:non-specific serine/threonine protein kinase
MSIGLGKRLGRFEILSRLGAGGMGEVYLARDVQLGRNVALKILTPEIAEDADRLSRFRREAIAASALNHPNILTIYDIGEAEGIHFIATEYVEGETLRAFLSAPRELSRVVDLFVQLCTALDAAHEAGIVHRDLKPENVMVRRDGYVKVVDFGLAKLLAAGADPTSGESGFLRTIPGTVLGTVRYMAPDQAPALAVDARVDVWSVGVMLYEALSGRAPFRGESAIDTVSQIIRSDPKPLAEAAPALPDALVRIVDRALKKNRDERFPTMSALLAELQGVKRGLASGRASAPRWTRATRQLGSSGAHRRTNISGTLPSLVGRDEELATIVGLLGEGQARLVTLTGTGGTGKTRLAQQVGWVLQESFADGVFFVDLSATSEPSLVASAIARALGADERGTMPLESALAVWLADKRMLLVVDNFEQVSDAAPLLVDLLNVAPGLSLLVTSRARLRLRAEREIEIPPLALPPPRASLEEIERSPAVRLFVARAAAANPDFALTAEDGETVAEICRRLDGLPLAIELAAARAKVLAPWTLLRRLKHRLKLLEGGALDLPKRQQTMRGTVAWSYGLLGRREQALFRHLSIYAGGWTLEAAEAIDAAAGDEEAGGGGGAAEVVDALASLVDKSLVRQQRAASAEPRFRMLEVVREFGLEQLDANDETARVGQVHADYFLALAEASWAGLVGADPSPTLARRSREHDNIRPALEWLFAGGGDAGPRLAASLSRFWSARNHYAEGRQWLEQALAATARQRTALRAKLLTGYGHLAQMQRDRHASLPRFEESLEIARELGDRTLVAAANVGIGIASTDFGDFARARACYEEVLEIARETGDERLAFHALNNLGEVARGERDWAAARAFYEEALSHEAKEASEWAGNAHVNLGAVAYYESRYDEMPDHFGKSLDAFRRAGDDHGVAMALSGFGAYAASTGEFERAARLAGAVEALCDTLGTRLDISDEVFFDEWRSTAREAMGEDAYDAAAAEGRRMAPSQVIDEAIPPRRSSESA